MTGVVSVTPDGVDDLDARLAGFAVGRADRGYAQAGRSPFPNLEVAWDPEVIVSAATVDDVRQAARFAAAHGLTIAVRGGGVGWCGAPPGTLLIDLASLRAIDVDPVARRVSAQCGATWRECQDALAEHGLAAAGPQFPSLGIAGYALGGGHGWLSGSLGWGSDTLVGADIVTADGQLVHADADHHPELFWGLRGAGHNLGIAVSLQFAVTALESATFGAIWFDPDQTAAALRAYRDWIVQAPDQLTTIVSVAHPPPALARQLDARHRGRACCHIILCHCGTPAQAQHDLGPVAGHRHVIGSDVRRRSWREIATGGDPFPPNVHRRSRMHYVSGLDDHVIATTVARAETMGELCFMSTHHYGGALRRVDEHATAMSHRDQAWNYMVTASWEPGQNGAAPRRWQEDYLHEISARSTGAYYVNYLFDEPEHVPAAYHPATWSRLRELKRAWDPDNLLATNQNIAPAVNGAAAAG